MAKKKFETDKKYYKMKNGEFVLTKTGARIPVSVYNGITLDEMIDWLIENGDDEDRKAFKEALFSYKDGTPMPTVKKVDSNEEYQKTNFINAKRKFFERHNAEYLPKKKETAPKEKISNRLADW